MIKINPSIHSVTAFAPATCTNTILGNDVLGFALEKIGDYVTLTRRKDNQILIESIGSKECLPKDVNKNIASFVVKKLCEDLDLDVGFSMHIQKGIPLSSGMGGSAASAVAALVACNGFLTSPLPQQKLIPYALLGEELATGQKHPDNIVPCIYGGLTLISSLNPTNVIKLPVPDVYCAFIHPHLHVPTDAISKIMTQKFDLPDFYKIKKLLLEQRALGMSLSGSGPSLFTLTEKENTAEEINITVRKHLKNANIDSDSWISRINKNPARIIIKSSR